MANKGAATAGGGAGYLARGAGDSSAEDGPNLHNGGVITEGYGHDYQAHAAKQIGNFDMPAPAW